MTSVKISPVAKSVPYDNSTSGLSATDTQAAIDELNAGGGSGASPGFQFTRSGNVSAGAYLQVGTVPSNTAGSPIGLSTARMIGITITNEIANTFTVEVEEHDGVTYTSLGTYALSAERSKSYNSLSIAITAGKELSVKVVSGSCKNVIVNIYIKGSAA